MFQDTTVVGFRTVTFVLFKAIMGINQTVLGHHGVPCDFGNDGCRCNGNAEAIETPIGYLPDPESFDLEGLPLTKADLVRLLDVDGEGWLGAAKRQTEFFSKFGDRFPSELLLEQQALITRLKSWKKVQPATV